MASAAGEGAGVEQRRQEPAGPVADLTAGVLARRAQGPGALTPRRADIRRRVARRGPGVRRHRPRQGTRAARGRGMGPTAARGGCVGR